MLNERVDGDGEEAGPEAERAEQESRSDQAMMRSAKQHACDGHADGTQRNEPVLDFVSAEPTGDHAADADADGQCGVQIAGFGLAYVQNVGAVDNDG